MCLGGAGVPTCKFSDTNGRNRGYFPWLKEFNYFEKKGGACALLPNCVFFHCVLLFFVKLKVEFRSKFGMWYCSAPNSLLVTGLRLNVTRLHEASFFWHISQTGIKYISFYFQHTDFVVKYSLLWTIFVPFFANVYGYLLVWGFALQRALSDGMAMCKPVECLKFT